MLGTGSSIYRRFLRVEKKDRAPKDRRQKSEREERKKEETV
jgi:hypothetical protein